MHHHSNLNLIWTVVVVMVMRGQALNKPDNHVLMRCLEPSRRSLLTRRTTQTQLVEIRLPVVGEGEELVEDKPAADAVEQGEEVEVLLFQAKLVQAVLAWQPHIRHQMYQTRLAQVWLAREQSIHSWTNRWMTSQEKEALHQTSRTHTRCLAWSHACKGTGRRHKQTRVDSHHHPRRARPQNSQETAKTSQGSQPSQPSLCPIYPKRWLSKNMPMATFRAQERPEEIKLQMCVSLATAQLLSSSVKHKVRKLSSLTNSNAMLTLWCVVNDYVVSFMLWLFDYVVQSMPMCYIVWLCDAWDGMPVRDTEEEFGGGVGQGSVERFKIRSIWLRVRSVGSIISWLYLYKLIQNTNQMDIRVIHA